MQFLLLVTPFAHIHLDEVDEKTKALRASTNYTVGDDTSALDKFQALLYSVAVTVPVKLVELYLDLRRMAEKHVRGFTEPSSDKLLPDLHPMEQHVYTLVLDLNETLIYSDWKRDRGWRTFKRIGVDAFLEHVAQFYEIMVYSDQLNMYVNPVEGLDPKHYIRYKLSRDGQVDLLVIENSQMESNCSGPLHITNSSCLPAGSSFTLRACSSTGYPVFKPGSDSSGTHINALTKPPLRFGERFKKAYEVILILDGREQFATQGYQNEEFGKSNILIWSFACLLVKLEEKMW